MKWLGITIAFIVVAAAIVLAVGTKTVSYEEKVPYQTTVQRPLSYRVVDTDTGSGSIFDVKAEGYVEIENTDTEPGTYTVSFSFDTLDRTFSDSAKVYIEPGETKRAKGVVDVSLGEDWNWDYRIEPSSKAVQKTKYRTETRHQSIPLYEWVYREIAGEDAQK